MSEEDCSRRCSLSKARTQIQEICRNVAVKALSRSIGRAAELMRGRGPAAGDWLLESSQARASRPG